MKWGKPAIERPRAGGLRRNPYVSWSSGPTAPFRAKEYVTEALGWMLEDRVVSGIEVTTETTRIALLIAVGLKRPGRDPVTFRFQHVWDHVEEDAAGG